MKALRSAVLMAAVLFVPAVAQAQTTLTACYVPKSGTVYRIKVEGAPGKCAQNHVEFSWTTQGALQFVKRQGLLTPVGPTFQTITAECQAGETPISGGYAATEDLLGNLPARVLVSRTVPANIPFVGWGITLASEQPVSVYATAWVLCATQGP